MAIKEYYLGIKSWSELNPIERRQALFDFLSYVSQNIRKTRREIIESFARSRNTTKYKAERLSKILWFSDILKTKAVGFPAKWYYVITPKGRTVLERGYFTPADFSEAPEWIRKSLERKQVIKIPIHFEFVGIDSETGYPIYYDSENEEYVRWNVEERKVIDTTSALEIDETWSIDTENGHTPFYAEITAKNVVAKMHPDEIAKREDEIQLTLKEFVYENFDENKKSGFLSDKIPNPDVIKVGVEYKLSRERPSDEVFIVIEKVAPDPYAGYKFEGRKRLKR